MRNRAPSAVIWTRDDCKKLETAGILDFHYELVAGDIIRTPGQSVPHRHAVMLLTVSLAMAFGADFVQSQATIDIAPEDHPTSEPEPDVAVMNVPMTALTGNPTATQVVLVVEVSDTTLQYDLTVKAGLYARAQIAEYWVVDINNRQLHVHRQPQNGAYRSVVPYPDTATVAPLAAPNSPTLVAQLLP
jgi:Uma2 family endonuclease